MFSPFSLDDLQNAYMGHDQIPIKFTSRSRQCHLTLKGHVFYCGSDICKYSKLISHRKPKFNRVFCFKGLIRPWVSDNTVKQ